VKYFFGSHIKRFINLKIFGATFGIGGGQLPPLPPLAMRLNATGPALTKSDTDYNRQRKWFKTHQCMFPGKLLTFQLNLAVRRAISMQNSCIYCR